MASLLTLLSVVSVLSTTPSTSFQDFLSLSSNTDKLVAETNSISNWDEYATFVASTNYSKNNNGSGSVSDSIIDVSSYLKTNYSNYYWIRDDDNCALTSDVSNAIPIEMQGTDFPEEEIEEAIKIANVANYTSYGGCGPIAAMGVLDYFARYLGYDEIISDPTDSDKRVLLATEVLTRTHFSIFSNQDATLVWPWDYSSAFNSVIEAEGLKGVISAHDDWTLFGGCGDGYWNTVVNNIDQGLPVTLFTGLQCGNGSFSQHYTNIYGYDTWLGVNSSTGETVTKKFIKARLNWDKTAEYYCDADILNCAQVGLITYNVNYANSYNFYDDDFAEEFVNSDGGGQYFFYTINQPVTLSNGKTLQTSRLRTSYIENKYLVLSPNRQNAGIAYLDITFPNPVSKLFFAASMWSGLEVTVNEDLKMQYYNGGWKNHISVELNDLSALKDYPDSFQALFPKDTNRIRFYATHSNPSGSRNKGRICLNNFTVEYN